MLAASSESGDGTRSAGSRRRSSSVTPWVSGSRDGSPGGFDPSGSSWAAKWPYRRIDCARLTAPTARLTPIALSATAPGSPADGGVQRSKIARDSASTDAGSRRYRSYSSSTYPRFRPPNSSHPGISLNPNSPPRQSRRTARGLERERAWGPRPGAWPGRLEAARPRERIGLAARNAQRAPVRSAQMLGEHHDLTHVHRGVRE